MAAPRAAAGNAHTAPRLALASHSFRSGMEALIALAAFSTQATAGGRGGEAESLDRALSGLRASSLSGTDSPAAGGKGETEPAQLADKTLHRPPRPNSPAAPVMVKPALANPNPPALSSESDATAWSNSVKSLDAGVPARERHEKADSDAKPTPHAEIASIEALTPMAAAPAPPALVPEAAAPGQAMLQNITATIKPREIPSTAASAGVAAAERAGSKSSAAMRTAAHAAAGRPQGFEGARNDLPVGLPGGDDADLVRLAAGEPSVPLHHPGHEFDARSLASAAPAKSQPEISGPHTQEPSNEDSLRMRPAQDGATGSLNTIPVQPAAAANEPTDSATAGRDMAPKLSLSRQDRITIPNDLSAPPNHVAPIHAASAILSAPVREAVTAQNSAESVSVVARAMNAHGVAGASRDPFVSLDGPAPAVAAAWVHAGPQRAEAGYNDPALGWVAVRAGLGGDGVHASLVPGSADAGLALGAHLAGLNAYLAEHHAGVSPVTVAAPESHNGEAAFAPGGGASGQQSDSTEQQPSQNRAADGSAGAAPVPAHSSVVDPVSAAATAGTPPAGRGIGTHISVVA